MSIPFKILQLMFVLGDPHVVSIVPLLENKLSIYNEQIQISKLEKKYTFISFAVYSHCYWHL